MNFWSGYLLSQKFITFSRSKAKIRSILTTLHIDPPRRTSTAKIITLRGSIEFWVSSIATASATCRNSLLIRRWPLKSKRSLVALVIGLELGYLLLEQFYLSILSAHQLLLLLHIRFYFAIFIFEFFLEVLDLLFILIMILFDLPRILYLFLKLFYFDLKICHPFGPLFEHLLLSWNFL